MDEPRWLKDEEKSTWRLYISATRLVEEALDRQMREDAGIPHSYYEILVHLSSEEDHSLRMSELAVRTLSSKSRLSHAVSKLEALGWVHRAACPSDKRGQLAVLTDEGMAALVEAAPGHVEEVRQRLFDPLTVEEQAVLGRACRKILMALGEDPDRIAADID
ncbi:MarR family winged helix-turn-helix transcriptional regulator [Euzebya rosea]|uniref:MarR family winged helix-turn-helix transcriptional regulator n=1 Tax=Euzebya rosea TaxID=2052804 RepID=UPI000D3E33A2|nr:MarR family transcriptional regulator [Euzebya rosea]